jgi:molybdenum cofactor cytidylyltransferase
VSVAAAVLAAGEGTRLERTEPKPLVSYRGRPLVTWALAAARDSGLTPVLLVVGSDGDAVGRAAGDDIHVVHAERWQEGIAHSLRAALDALVPELAVDAVCVGLADQPRVGAEAYTRLAAAHQRGAVLAVATYDGVRGNPVLLDRALWPVAQLLEGDTGAKALMKDHAVVEVDCTGTGDPRDVDTLDDLRALETET